MKHGGYACAEDVVVAALESLQQQKQLAEFVSGEFDTLLQKGEQSGKPLDGEKVLAEFRNLRTRSRKVR